MAVTEEARAARDAKLDELHERLTGAVETLVSGEDWARALEFAARFRSRSFNNTLLIWVQHEAAFEAGRVPEPFPTLVAGYRQWQGLGRQVMKGQPGYMIFAPVTGRFASSNPADPNSWRRLGPREKHKVNEVVRSRMVGARPAYVWDPLSRVSGLAPRVVPVSRGRVRRRNGWSARSGFERVGGIVGEFLGALHRGADAFDFELSGGDLPGGFADLSGFVEGAGVAVEHEPAWVWWRA